VNYCPLRETETAVVPGIGETGALKVKVSLVLVNGVTSRIPSLTTGLQVELASNPDPARVIVVPP
jgi:hypothetical protein